MSTDPSANAIRLQRRIFGHAYGLRCRAGVAYGQPLTDPELARAVLGALPVPGSYSATMLSGAAGPDAGWVIDRFADDLTLRLIPPGATAPFGTPVPAALRSALRQAANLIGARLGGDPDGSGLQVHWSIEDPAFPECDPLLAAELIALACGDRLSGGVGLREVDVARIPAHGFAEVAGELGFLAGFRPGPVGDALRRLPDDSQIVIGRESGGERIYLDLQDDIIPPEVVAALRRAGARVDRDGDIRPHWPLPRRSSRLRPRRAASLAEALTGGGRTA